MTVDTPSRMVPQLRFAEFRDAGEWEEIPLADLYSFKRTNTLSRDKLNYETGKIRNVHYGDIHTKFKPIFKVVNEDVPYINSGVAVNGYEDDTFCEIGDIIFADASEDLDDVGKAIEVVSLDGERVASGTHTILATRRKDLPIVGFGAQLFQSAAVRARIKKEAQGAKVYGISANRISLVLLPLPASKAEQQKIADCLRSLDDLIAAQGQKLEALREHKQGLMQQLFPRPGETVPKLRFPDFKDTGEWGLPTVGGISTDVVAGGTPNTTVKEYWNGDIRWMNSGELNLKRVHEVQGRITEKGLRNSSTRLIPARCVLVGLADQGKTRGTVAMNLVELCTNQSIAAIFPNDTVFDSDFLFHQLDQRYVELRRLSSGGEGRGGLNLQIIKGLAIPLPLLREQEKIAQCLTSLDDLIAAQLQRLEALRQHKQGLLQQLFPSPVRASEKSGCQQSSCPEIPQHLDRTSPLQPHTVAINPMTETSDAK